MDSISNLRPETYAIMVHKLYADRVRDFLTTTNRNAAADQWHKLILKSSSVASPSSMYHWNDQPIPPADCKNSKILDVPAITGVSRARRGYVLLLVEVVAAPQKSIHQLSPMARQNISWIAPLSHSHENRKDSVALAAPSATHAGASSFPCHEIWNCILDNGFSLEPKQEHFLRIDCYPKKMALQLCNSLQDFIMLQQTQEHGHNRDDNDSPIPMSLSREKCTHRLFVIAIAHESQCSGGDNDGNDHNRYEKLYWGVMSKEQHTSFWSLALNSDAHNEIQIQNKDNNPDNHHHQTMASTPTTSLATLPVSRAYFKLKEVLQVYDMKHEIKRLFLEHFAVEQSKDAGGQFQKKTKLSSSPLVGLDLGAAPGGWTQALLDELTDMISLVVAVDRGQLASCLQRHHKVHHICQTIQEFANAVQQQFNYSVVVCDISQLWKILLQEYIVGELVSQMKCTLPSVWIITMKMPFCTLGSIARQIADMKATVPGVLRAMARSLYQRDSTTGSRQHSIRIRFQLVHLMANSDAERTLIAIFEEDEQRK